MSDEQVAAFNQLTPAEQAALAAEVEGDEHEGGGDDLGPDVGT